MKDYYEPGAANPYYRITWSVDYRVYYPYVFRSDSKSEDQDWFQSVNSIAKQSKYYSHFDTTPSLRDLPEIKYPFLYFQTHYHSLRILGSNIQISVLHPLAEKDRILISEAIGIDLSAEDYRTIYELLESIKEYYTDYYRALLEFKWQYSLISFPLFDQIERLQLRNGWLYITENGNLLNQDYVISQLKPTEKETLRKNHALFSGLTNKLYTLRKELTSETSDPYTNDNDDSNDQWPLPEYGVGCYAQYHPIHHRSTVYRCSRFASDVGFVPPVWKAVNSLTPSIDLVEYLKALTDGSPEKLDLLAEFFARLFCPGIPSKYIWVPKGISVAKFVFFLRELVGNSVSFNLFTLSRKRESNLIYDYMWGIKIQTPNRILKSNNINNYRITRYLSGESVTSTDPFQQYNAYRYCPLILMDQQNEIVGREGFPVSKRKFIELPEQYAYVKYNLNVEDALWLKTCFVSYGLSLIRSADESSDNCEGRDHLYLDFCQRYCVHDPSTYTDLGNFYSSLKQYAEAINRESLLPGKTTAMKEIVSLMDWKTCVVRRNNNRKAIEWIRLDCELLNQDLEMLSTQDRFLQRINEISSMVTFIS